MNKCHLRAVCLTKSKLERVLSAPAKISIFVLDSSIACTPGTGKVIAWNSKSFQGEGLDKSGALWFICLL